MKIFMLGWEFPPYISGGLGTACYGLTRGLNQLGHQITFVLPRNEGVEPLRFAADQALSAQGMNIPASLDRPDQSSDFTNVTFRAIPATLQPYDSPEPNATELRAKSMTSAGTNTAHPPVDTKDHTSIEMSSRVPHNRTPSNPSAGPYACDMFSEVDRYAQIAKNIALKESFDVIHAHDWMTFPAGMAIASASGRPLVVHIHSTEFDRSGQNVNQRIYNIERQGIHAAHRVIAVSHLTRNLLLGRYDAPEEKVEVVYNAIDQNGHPPTPPPAICSDEKIVLFLGRITMQKGPEYFLAAAKKVLDYEKNVRFIMAGSGDLIRRSIDLAHQLEIEEKVLFTGFLRGDDVARVFRMADLYVMPSVSEPFGIAPLEALANDVPVLISKQSGVGEILTHVLKVDFWDINEMANKIIAVLRHPPLQITLRKHGSFEVRQLTWSVSAQNCLNVYHHAIAAMN